LVTGLGIVSAAGSGLASTEAALRAGRSGLGPLTLFESPRNGHFPVAELGRELASPRLLELAKPALRQALDAAGLTDGDALARTGLALGTCVGGMPETENAVAEVLADGAPSDREVWSRHGCGYTTAQLARWSELGGPALTLSTACSSGAQAIVAARDVLRSGLADTMVAGGADAICRLTLNGFAALLAMDPDGCKPFDRARAGMSLGEAAAFLVLERESVARRSGKQVFGELAGAGNSCDAFHLTAPEPQGRGAFEAMATALNEAGLEPSEVDYVNAHGTGTQENDRAEGRALAQLFGDDVPAVSSTKRVFGHTLGAAGAVEAVVSLLAMRAGFVPGTSGLEDVDPECVIAPLVETRAAAPRVVLSSSFGFGGNNTVLVFGAVT